MTKFQQIAKAILLSSCASISLGSLHAAVPKDSLEHPSATHARVETSRTAWWSKARFGMFIHWGVYTIPSGKYDGKDVSGLGEWIMHDARIPVATYKNYAKKFNPTEYNPKKWVKMAKDAGMKYIVITTKHHDGFALFDTKASDWNVVKATPYGKDLIKPLAEACRKQGMKLGFYYSQANDWGNKGGAAARGQWDEAQKGSMDEYIDQVAIPQVREILTKYGDVAELWWDVPTDMTKERAAKFLPLLALQPQIISNDRLGGGIKGDLFTPEQYIPATGIDGLWETCMTINDTWGFKESDQNWKSSKTLVRNLIETASKGGNYLLNVGPEASGKFPQPIVDRLIDIGKWMRLNSEAIYNTTASPFKTLAWGRATARTEADGNTTIYLHIYNWPANARLIVPGLKNTVISAKLLTDKKILAVLQDDQHLIIDVTEKPLDEIATVLKLTIKGKPDLIPYVVKPDKDGSIILQPGLADFMVPKGGDLMRAEGEEEQNIGYWTDPRAFASWQFHIPEPGTYQIEAWVSSLDETTIKLMNGSERVSKKISGTGGYDKYQRISLGKIHLANPGVNTITLSSDQANWKPVNIRQIILKP